MPVGFRAKVSQRLAERQEATDADYCLQNDAQTGAQIKRLQALSHRRQVDSKTDSLALCCPL